MRLLEMCALLFVLACGSSTGEKLFPEADTKNGEKLFPEADTKNEGVWVVPLDTSSDCTPNDTICDGNTVMMCSASGNGWSIYEACTDGFVCGNGACVTCQPNQRLCQGNSVVECNEAGNVVPVEACSETMLCTAGACVICTPGVRECRTGVSGDSEVWRCEGVGTAEAEWQLQQTCTGNLDCVDGLCLNPCSSDIKLNTNQGCDYYAVDLENVSEKSKQGVMPPSDAQFAILVTNPSASKPLGVEISETQKGEPIVTAVVQPGGHEVFPLGPRNIVGTVQGEYAWRVKGNRPFVAYQFNPLDNVNPVYSNDASLLLPVNALGTDYMVMTGSGNRSFVTVVGTKSQTEVIVTVTAATMAGDQIPALNAGEQFTTILNAGEVLNILAAYDSELDLTLTGSTVTASKNVAVFGGNVSALSSDKCCADHLEQQMFPTKSWGKKFVCTKSQTRLAENDYWRILAREDATTVTLSGGISDTKILQAGNYVEIPTASDFMIQSDKPILVGQILASSFEIKPAGEVCLTDTDCASGVCFAIHPSFGICMETCQASQSECANNEMCLDHQLMKNNSPKGAGSCYKLPCGALLPECPNDTLCIIGKDNPDEGHCVETCANGGTCSNPNKECNKVNSYGYLCVRKNCLTHSDCSNGLCSTSGACVPDCTPQKCADGKSACYPAEFSSDLDIDICIAPKCNSDADCRSGHTCSTKGSCEPIGDPAFILAVPVEQFRDEYTFLTPNAYKKDYINVVAPKTASVQLDGQDIPWSNFTPIPDSEHMVARLPVSDGAHTLKATQPVGLVVYGFHRHVSYGYPGGANLFDLGQ